MGAELAKELGNEAFNEMDLDKNGYVTIDELRKYKIKQDPRLKGNHKDLEKQVNEMFTMLDKNGDKKITREEFIEGLSKVMA